MEKAAFQGVNRNDLHEVVVSIPPTKAEQEAIAAVLSDADALIESLEQLIAKKRQIKQGAMQELLTGKKRLPGFATKPGYKQTEVGVTPEDVADVVDAVCALAIPHKICFPWRPDLCDRKDELVLELAVAARCDYIITYNQRDFRGAEMFGIRLSDPRAFLQAIGELP